MVMGGGPGTCEDMKLSTLRRLIHALGGELELIVRLPGGDIRLRQFIDAA